MANDYFVFCYAKKILPGKVLAGSETLLFFVQSILCGREINKKWANPFIFCLRLPFFSRPIFLSWVSWISLGAFFLYTFSLIVSLICAHQRFMFVNATFFLLRSHLAFCDDVRSSGGRFHLQGSGLAHPGQRGKILFLLVQNVSLWMAVKPFKSIKDNVKNKNCYTVIHSGTLCIFSTMDDCSFFSLTGTTTRPPIVFMTVTEN